jgi:hypothetical protein
LGRVLVHGDDLGSHQEGQIAAPVKVSGAYQNDGDTKLARLVGPREDLPRSLVTAQRVERDGKHDHSTSMTTRSR